MPKSLNAQHEGTSGQMAQFSLTELEGLFEGQVILPDHPSYDVLRTPFYGGIDRHPALIVRAANAADVARVVDFARENSLELAVRSGGHSYYGVTEGGIVLDLRDMQALDIDPESRTAWAETGLTAGAYTEAAAEHGLATGFGDAATVGIGGITVGGGVGYLVRKYGLTIDDVLAAEVVTADGQLLYVDAENHPDLFWAIRGGGGNFGVVTRFKYRLHEVDEVFGGMIMLPASAEIIAGAVAAAEAAPEELSGMLNIMAAPPMPFIPEAYHGQIVVFGLLVYAGDVANGEAVFAPFRALAEPLMDMIKPIHYPEMYHEEEGEEYHPTAINTTMFLNKIDEATAETILTYLRASDAVMRVAQVRVLGGAMARVPDEATAFAHRQAPIMVNLAAFYNDAEDKIRRAAWLKEFQAALDQGIPGGYVNFLSEDAAIQSAYPPATLARLRAVKAKYDPDNLFRLNHNIAPSAVEA